MHHPRSKRRVLVVDDEEPTRNALCELLEDEFVVLGRADAEGALQTLDGETPDVVVTDLTMPGLGGAELVRRLREQHPQVPVVVMSARARPATIPAGEVPFFAKPIDVTALRRLLRRLVVAPEIAT